MSRFTADDDLITGAVRTLHGLPDHATNRRSGPADAVPRCLSRTRGGRTVTVANASIAIEGMVAGGEHVRAQPSPRSNSERFS